MYKKRNILRAFTLIELLLVMAITSLIGTLVFINMSGQRAKARDQLRRATLLQLQIAIQLYRDKYGAYPSTMSGGFTQFYSSEPGNPVTDNGGNWIPGLAPEFIPALPRDPLGGYPTVSPCNTYGFKRGYLYFSNGSNGYGLGSFCAMENALPNTDPLYSAVTPNTAKVCSGQGGYCNSI